MANYLTFAEIIAEVERAVKQYQSSMQPLVKSIINQVYLNEVMQCDNLYPLHWMHGPIQAKLHAAKTITGITAAEPPVVTSAAHGFIGGEVISIWDVEGMEEVNFDYKRLGNISLFVVTTVAVNTFELYDLWGSKVDGSGWTAYTSGGTILHHGWSISSATFTDFVKSVRDVGIYDGMPLQPITWKDLLESLDTWICNSSATPYRFLHYQTQATTGIAYDYILTFPGAQENKQAIISIEASPIRLSAAADVPLLPAQFHDTIISGAITRLMESNVQVENAVVWPGLYKMQIEAIKSYNRRWWKQHEADMGGPYLL